MLPFHIMSNIDAKSNVLIGQESAPKPSPSPSCLRDHTCKPQMVSDVDPTPTDPCYTTACLRFFSLPPPFPPLINSKPSNLICTKLHVGSPEAGLAETIEFVLKGYSVDVQSLLVSNIFLTGGCASIPGLVPRLDKELREMRPFESQFHLTLAADPVLDAWHGAQELISSSSLSRCFVTRAEYEEKGGEFFKEHSASNHYFPSPVPLQAEIVPAPACVEEVEIDVF
uniref:Actin-related protein 5 n=1 Tax=Timema poppense TaxID=170557 RepID=A0A7R9CNT7_TIMPO|nr:unnamed protein product [Timema poppensis]